MYRHVLILIQYKVLLKRIAIDSVLVNTMEAVYAKEAWGKNAYGYNLCCSEAVTFKVGMTFQ